MKKTRIVERTHPDGRTEWVIQVKHWLFRWMWVDGWINSWHPYVNDTFHSLKAAQANLCWFDGTKTKDKVVG